MRQMENIRLPSVAHERLCLRSLNPLSPNSDENEISLYIITTC